MPLLLIAACSSSGGSNSDPKAPPANVYRKYAIVDRLCRAVGGGMGNSLTFSAEGVTPKSFRTALTTYNKQLEEAPKMYNPKTKWVELRDVTKGGPGMTMQHHDVTAC
jgi:hypothetical protein